MRDENQIAFGILRTLLLTEPQPGETPAQRHRRANGYASGARIAQYAHIGGQASKDKLPMDQRRANGLKGAIARWGTIKEIIPPMPASRKNLDMNQLAKRILGEATGEEPKTEAPAPKLDAKAKAGAVGGKKGGAARASSLSPAQRSEIAKKAAAARWKP